MSNLLCCFLLFKQVGRTGFVSLAEETINDETMRHLRIASLIELNVEMYYRRVYAGCRADLRST